MTDRDPTESTHAAPCRCSGTCSGIGRRDFITTAAMSAAAALSSGLPAMAGPFEAAEFEKLVPADKKLDPAWVKSLTARGEPAVYQGSDLEKIGMPVGGLYAGQLYLGGDGRLWHWDMFNQMLHTGAAHYANPPKPSAPLEQGLALRFSLNGQTQVRRLNQQGFSEVRFRGQYPIGTVEYRDPACPLTVTLEAYSPFVPLDADNSSLPATVLRMTVKNTGEAKVDADLAAWLENAVCLHSAVPGAGERSNRVHREARLLRIDSAAAPVETVPRDDILFEDFQKETYEGWDVTGEAFGKGPILKSHIPSYQGDVGGSGARVANSHASAPGNDVGAKDDHVGTLTSRPFTIERNFIAFWIGGGGHAGKTCLNLLVDGKPVRSATGKNDNRMQWQAFDVRGLEGKKARIEIVDKQKGAWGNIGVDRIVFTDRPAGKFHEQADFGSMSLALLAPTAADRAVPAVPEGSLPEMVFLAAADRPEEAAARPFGQRLCGALVRRMELPPQGEATATLLLTWHFPNLKLKDGGRFYASRFSSSAAVASYLAENFDMLDRQTRLWRDTWYDSTLPHWFLDRTLLNASILATSTCHRFASGRFYGWEGVGCCEGTCTHVWHYAHAVARLFPELERDLRRRTDFGLALDEKTGIINHRGEGAGLAVDGQAGCILRVYREHQMSPDAAFLKPLWPKVKLAMEALVRMDLGDGLLAGAQHNTLDQPWFGRVAWLSSLYVAAARACEEMAREMNEQPFADQMRAIVQRGSRSIDRELFNGEYYVHLVDQEHQKSVGSHNGCEIDQVFGQSWAFQLGLGRLLSEENVKKALRALWRYNFTPDVGPYRKRHVPGRWYAMAGEAGLLMCSWPRGDAARVQEGFDFYFNECMTGFEYQVAGHMLWEGMVEEGLAITRAIHDRYHPSRRNPWNEVECGDHYARAMASYGVFLAACGYQYHGPKGHLGFAPRLSPDDFRAPFTTAEGWGTFSQRRSGPSQTGAIALKWGKLRLQSLSLALAKGAKPEKVQVKLGETDVPARLKVAVETATVELVQAIVIEAGQTLEVRLG